MYGYICVDVFSINSINVNNRDIKGITCPICGDSKRQDCRACNDCFDEYLEDDSAELLYEEWIEAKIKNNE